MKWAEAVYVIAIVVGFAWLIDKALMLLAMLVNWAAYKIEHRHDQRILFERAVTALEKMERTDVAQ